RQLNGRSKPLPYQESNIFCSPYLPLVVARRGEIRKNKISYVFSYSLAQLRALGESILCYFLAFPKK
ncbi:MAG: hypothetical protein IJW09_06510, partial [Clostridia bacterium]|nr:hypothetical protein [Clostridia bacterium]